MLQDDIEGVKSGAGEGDYIMSSDNFPMTIHHVDASAIVISSVKAANTLASVSCIVLEEQTREDIVHLQECNPHDPVHLCPSPCLHEIRISDYNFAQ